MDIYLKLIATGEQFPIVNANCSTLEYGIGIAKVTMLPNYRNFKCEDNVEIVAYENVIFTGKIRRFKISESAVKLRIYDEKWDMQMNTETYVCEKKTLSDIFRYMADSAGVPIGDVAETSRVVPYKIFNNIQCSKIVYELVREEKFFTGRHYVVYGRNGKLNLGLSEDMRIKGVITQAFDDISLRSSIQDLTFNDIRIRQTALKFGGTKVTTALDKESIDKYGKICYTYSIHEDEDAEVVANNILNIYKNPYKTIDFTCVGNSEVHAGCIISIDLPFRGKQIKSDVRVISVHHLLDKNGYIMHIHGVLDYSLQNDMTDAVVVEYV
jgi:hypothetical protein